MTRRSRDLTAEAVRKLPQKPKKLAHLSDEEWAKAWELASREPVFYPEHADKFCNEDYELEFVDEDGNPITIPEDDDDKKTGRG